MQAWLYRHPVLYGLAVFAVFYMTLEFVGSWWSGWAQLARKFPLTGRFAGQRRFFQTAYMRWQFGYRGVLVAGTTADGLYLSARPFFPIFHPALLIPWSQIRVRRSETFFDGIALTLDNDPRIPITLQGRIADDLRAAPALRASGESTAS
ncbi:MAG TPA: hypothetical protein VKR43_11650 [Bryobacteraceae bacterium]|nr:hypothetical protein [Bryobacteraceae bacterium]